MKPVSELKIKIFADGADRAGMLELYRCPWIRGFTTNPTLMRKAGVSDYEGFALEILAHIKDRPISFEVLADDESEMARQAHHIAAWGDNVYVKIPVTNTRGVPMYDLMRRLCKAGIKINVTACLSLDHVRRACTALRGGAPCYISVFAGRVADTGRDPVPLMAKAAGIVHQEPDRELIWASPRELLNILQADAAGCDVITVTSDILKKLPLIGKDLDEFSRETVLMFYEDAIKSGYSLEPEPAGAIADASSAPRTRRGN